MKSSVIFEISIKNILDKINKLVNVNSIFSAIYLLLIILILQQ